MARVVLWQQLVGYPAALDRQLIAEIWPIAGRVRAMTATAATGRNVNIAPGSIVVAMGGGMGSVLCVSDAIESVVIPDPPAAGSYRVDNVLAQVTDAAIGPETENGWTYVVQLGQVGPPGTPGPIPPARSEGVCQVVSVGGQANLDQSNVVMLRQIYVPQPPPVTPVPAQMILNVSARGPGLGNALNPFEWDQLYNNGAIGFGGSWFQPYGPGLWQVGMTIVWANDGLPNSSNPAAFWQIGLEIDGNTSNRPGLGAWTGFDGLRPGAHFTAILRLNGGERIVPFSIGNGMLAALHEAAGELWMIGIGGL